MVTHPIPIPPNDDPAAVFDLFVFQDPKGRFWDGFNGTWITTLASATVYPGHFPEDARESAPPEHPPAGLTSKNHVWRRLSFEATGTRPRSMEAERVPMNHGKPVHRGGRTPTTKAGWERAARAYLRDVFGVDTRRLAKTDPAVVQALKWNIRTEPSPGEWPLDRVSLRLIIEAEKKAGEYKPSDDPDFPPALLRAVLAGRLT